MVTAGGTTARSRESVGAAASNEQNDGFVSSPSVMRQEGGGVGSSNDSTMEMARVSGGMKAVASQEETGDIAGLSISVQGQQFATWSRACPGVKGQLPFIG